MDPSALWKRYQERFWNCPALACSLDCSRMDFPSDFFARMEARMQKALEFMEALESGAIANPDEQRMVGHYWLRAPARAPTAAIRKEIEDTLVSVKRFARSVHAGRIAPARGARFSNLLVIGIGGSALGPQFVSQALGGPKDRLRLFFLDNTDPDGMDQVFAQLNAAPGGFRRTLAVVISKSGGTKETRNGMLEAAAAFERLGSGFSPRAVAVTGAGSELDRFAAQQGWLARFPMWDWVGGRTSVTSAVGLLPAALQGLDVDGLLQGAADMDQATRNRRIQDNPAALLALAWFHAGEGRVRKAMVLLPYKDRLTLFSKYLQQLVMESLGKELDLEGRPVNQGLTVYGNKGSTDQHAYVQQLRDGPNDFFVTFVEVLRDRAGRSPEVEPGVTSGDYLSGFLQGTRRALYEKGRESLTLTLREVDAARLGMLVALYERAVGLYAQLIGVNAYHQPGVEAGKKAAGEVLALQRRLVERLNAEQGRSFTAAELAEAVGAPAEVETAHWILRHLAANVRRNIRSTPGRAPFETRYGLKG
jgi:glucose-6-phosphate isomerase